MSILEKHRNYSVAELKQLLGANWREAAGIPYQPVIQNKPIINSFSEFDEETKQIYLEIYNITKSRNPNTTVKVWATGSRVKGTWKTNAEAEQYAIDYKCRVKYSDYDCIIVAAVTPTKEELSNIVGVRIDFAGGEGHKVLIEP
jgi:hypothetical protein